VHEARALKPSAVVRRVGDGTMNDTCTTTRAFDVYGVTDGSVLVRTTHRLVHENDRGTVTDATLDLVAAAFRAAFMEHADVGALPADVAAAVEDALYFTRERYADSDADLRTEVLPSFYREVAGFHCAYRGHPTHASEE
jgi:hypothetical protein